MDKGRFIRALRSAADELKPLTQSALAGSATWDGTQFAKTGARAPDPYALAWWSVLRTVADLVEAQEAPLDESQIAYLRRLLFGGMGSLNDLAFDRNVTGVVADAINEGLNRKRQLLFESFVP